MIDQIIYQYRRLICDLFHKGHHIRIGPGYWVIYKKCTKCGCRWTEARQQ